METQFNETSRADINLVINDDGGGGIGSRRLGTSSVHQGNRALALCT